MSSSPWQFADVFGLFMLYYIIYVYETIPSLRMTVQCYCDGPPLAAVLILSNCFGTSNTAYVFVCWFPTAILLFSANIFVNGTYSHEGKQVSSYSNLGINYAYDQISWTRTSGIHQVVRSDKKVCAVKRVWWIRHGRIERVNLKDNCKFRIRRQKCSCMRPIVSQILLQRSSVLR